MRRSKHFIKNILCVALLPLFFSCSTSRTTVSGTSREARLAGVEHVEAVLYNSPSFETFSSRLRLTLPRKKDNYTLNGTLIISKDQIIRITLQVPILRTEAARIEITPQGVQIIDRINKRYTVASVADLKVLLRTEVDYFALQSLLSNGLFLPGKTVVDVEDLSGFQVDSRRSDKVILSRKSNNLTYYFATSYLNNRLVESMIESSGSTLVWQYAGFESVGNTVFPSEMTVKIGKGNTLVQTTMELTRMSVGHEDIKQTALPARYEEMALKDLLKMFEYR